MGKEKQKVQVQQFTVTRKITLTEKHCLQCSTRFMGRKNKIYCSVPCANKAAYWRSPEEHRESRLKSYRKAKGEAKK